MECSAYVPSDKHDFLGDMPPFVRLYISSSIYYLWLIYFYLNFVISQDILLSTCSCDNTSNTLSLNSVVYHCPRLQAYIISSKNDNFN